MSKTASDKWTEFHADRKETNYPKWPNEVMLKVFFGDYLEKKITLKPKMKICDIGCGFGQNLLPFVDKGYASYGVEVSSDICGLTEEIMLERGYKVTIKNGHNRHIPFNDNMFDVLISINALHYEKTEDDLKKALKEYNRVLKEDGILYLSTVGPGHTIYKNAQTLGNHQYKIQNYDFRNGEQYFYFDNLKYLTFYLSEIFVDIEVGQVTENLMKHPLDFLIAVCRKKR